MKRTNQNMKDVLTFPEDMNRALEACSRLEELLQSHGWVYHDKGWHRG